MEYGAGIQPLTFARYFKFVQKRYMDAFFATGSLKLGTLLRYQDTLKYQGTQGDAFEGRAQHGRFVESVNSTTDDSLGPILDEILYNAPGSTVILQKVMTQIERRSPDAFVFCMSYLCSEDLLRRYRDEWKADACYAIENTGYFDAITEVCAGWSQPLGCQMVQYTPDDVIDHRSELAKVHPALVKREGPFAWQREVRALWSPRLPTTPLQEVFRDVPKARAFARPVAFLEGDSIRWL